VLFLVFALFFSGCDILTKLGFGSDDDSDEGGMETAPGVPVAGAAGIASIKAKFGVTATGTDAVNETFNELHAYIQKGGLADEETTVIRPGDYIDLEGGLTVEGTGTFDTWRSDGGFSLQDNPVWNQDITCDGEPRGRLNRLIVVGINSFQTGRGSDGQYAYPEDEDAPPPHIVFQFQNTPVSLGMNDEADDRKTGGYEVSMMRTYLAENFLPGLKEAGVPEGALWAPARYVSTHTEKGAVKIRDTLWIPTVREMFFDGADGYDKYESVEETAENQTWFEYYTDGNSRLKVRDPYGTPPDATGYNSAYRLASALILNRTPCASGFCHVSDMGTRGGSNYSSNLVGKRYIAPAFCVK
jgi:hypothetical protein